MSPIEFTNFLLTSPSRRTLRPLSEAEQAELAENREELEGDPDNIARLKANSPKVNAAAKQREAAAIIEQTVRDFRAMQRVRARCAGRPRQVTRLLPRARARSSHGSAHGRRGSRQTSATRDGPSDEPGPGPGASDEIAAARRGSV